MHTLVPWLALLVGSAALVAALMPHEPPPLPVPAHAGADPAQVVRLQAEVADLRSAIAHLQTTPTPTALAGDTTSAPVAVDDAHLRELIQEALRKDRAQGGGNGGGPNPGQPWGQPPAPIDTVAASAQMAEKFAIEPAQATVLVEAMADMQKTVSTAFASGDREQAMATLRTAREKLEATVATIIPAERQEEFRRYAMEQFGMRGGRGGQRQQRGADAGAQPANAPTPGGVKEF